jgi:SPP1 gp7 family putative phage head morphogenesis protein
MPNVIELADQFHDQLERQDAQALARILRAYAGITTRLQGEIDALALEIEQGGLTVGQVQKLARYRRLLDETAAEVQKFTAFMDVELGAMGREYVARGLTESGELLRAAVDNQAALVARFRGLPPEAVERLLGFLDPQGPLYKRLQLLPGFVANAVSETILQSVALGRNPRTLARELTKAYGMGLSDSLRMARTVQLYSYREAARANYVANSGIVKGWQWYASLDSSVCLSCVAQHGKVYPLDQPLNDHHNGRCTQLPVTILSPNGHIEQDAGKKWFNGLSEAEQKKMMGPGMHEAWKGEKFEFDALSVEKTDEVYGKMRGQASLKALMAGGSGAPVGNAPSLASYRGKIAGSKSEIGGVFDKQGNLLFEKEGGKTHITFTRQEFERMRGNVLIHNHPGGDQSFSLDDIKSASEFQMAEIQVVTEEHWYSMKPPEGGWSWEWRVSKLEPEYWEARQKVVDAWNKGNPQGLVGKAAEESFSQIYHQIWEIVSNKTGMQYTRRAQK